MLTRFARPTPKFIHNIRPSAACHHVSLRMQSKETEKAASGQKSVPSEQQQQQEHTNEPSELSPFPQMLSTPSLFSDPFFSGIDRDMTRMMNWANSLVNRFPMSITGAPMTSQQFIPSIDVRETNEAYEMVAEVPGVKKEDLKLDFNDKNRMLTLRGENKFEKERKDATWHTLERRFGRFQRSIRLPENANYESIKADYKDGVLHISIPKEKQREHKQEHHVKHIEIGS